MKIAIVGFGKVGYHLSKAFLNTNAHLTAVYNRSAISKPAFLPESIPIIHELGEIPEETELLILSISDDQISNVSKNLPTRLKQQSIIAHSSGIHGIQLFDDSIRHKAAFYPLNSFSKEGTIDWSETPIFITSESSEIKEKLLKLAESISQNVYQINDEQKAVLHTAAVFVNNFPNALFRMAHHVLKENKLEFEALSPLIRTTFEKIKNMSPDEAQTGPASRGDMKTIQKHYEILTSYPFEKQVYQLLTQYINPKLQDHHEND